MISAERLRGIEVVTFDCYGTLIDWESGILGALTPILKSHGKSVEPSALLRHYGELEAAIEAKEYRPYREVLGLVVDGIGERFKFTPTKQQRASLAQSVPDWKPFPDTVDALNVLARRFRLGVISNVDADLFEGSARQLGFPFEWVVLAEHVKAYKPNARNFVAAIEATGMAANRILHAAQSVYHDVIPATVLGLATALVKRRGFGAARPAEATADLEVNDLKSLATELLRA